MSQDARGHEAFRDDLVDFVTSRVRRALRIGAEDRLTVVRYLQELETVARADNPSRQVVQVIASGRRLLGDRSEVRGGDSFRDEA